MRHTLLLASLFLAPTLLGAGSPPPSLASAPGSETGPTQPLEGRELLGGRLQLLVPTDFETMTEEAMKAKYPAEQRPTLVLTNPRGTVNVALNHTSNPLQPTQISEVHQAMDGMFRNLYPTATWHRSELTTVGGREFFVLDLMTPAVDTQIRNLLVGTSFEGRLLLVTFNCTRELDAEWSETGRRIIESIELREP